MVIIAPPSIETQDLENEGESLAVEVACQASESEIKLKLKRRLRRLLRKNVNKLCMDCSKPSPKWAAMLVVPSAHGVDSPYAENYCIGGLVCLECSGAHRRLGTHLSFVRSIELDTLKKHEIKALETGGNQEVNNIFEGNFIDSKIDQNEGRPGIVQGTKPDPTSGQKEREAFIRQKYEKKAYVSIKALARYRQSMINRDSASPKSLCTPLSADSTSPASQAPINSPERQLQIFTSSPRTLAMIEKYMNPKTKKKGLRKMKFSFKKRFSGRTAFKGDLRNLRGVVEVNPNLNVVETRSDYIPSPTRDDLDEADEGSIESTHSSMSATIRRRLLRYKKDIITPPSKRTWFSPAKSNSSKGKGPRTPSSKKSTHTSTPKSADRSPTKRKKFFSKNNNGNRTANEFEGYDARKDHFPSPVSSTDSSRRQRFVFKLRTPSLKEKLTNSGKSKNQHFFADDAGLDVVKESNSTEDMQQKAEIKDMRLWSRKLDNVLSKVLKKKRGVRNNDEATLLRDGSNDSF